MAKCRHLGHSNSGMLSRHLESRRNWSYILEKGISPRTQRIVGMPICARSIGLENTFNQRTQTTDSQGIQVAQLCKVMEGCGFSIGIRGFA